MAKIRLNINGMEVTGYAGQTILEVARENGIEIPTLCYDERVAIYGACGLCVVEMEGNPKLLRACATTISEGMVINTNTKRVKDSRKAALELLLSDHTGDCRPPCALACPAGTDCQGYVGLVAFAGAFLVSMGVIALANIGGRATSVKLILAGTALSAICAAVSNFFLYVINTSSGALEAVVRWTMGSLAAASWDTNLWMLAVAVLGALFFWTQYRTLNLMLLGDEAAVTLGTDLHRWRIVYLLAASLLVGFAVYTAGIIGFVGLVIPHVVRILFGTDHKKLIPISALLGAIFLLWSDVLCRVVLPGKEIPIGVLTALVGAPVFIYLMARKKYGFGGGD